MPFIYFIKHELLCCLHHFTHFVLNIIVSVLREATPPAEVKVKPRSIRPRWQMYPNWHFITICIWVTNKRAVLWPSAALASDSLPSDATPRKRPKQITLLLFYWLFTFLILSNFIWCFLLHFYLSSKSPPPLPPSRSPLVPPHHTPSLQIWLPVSASDFQRPTSMKHRLWTQARFSVSDLAIPLSSRGRLFCFFSLSFPGSMVDGHATGNGGLQDGSTNW